MYKTEVEKGPPVRAIFSYQDTFELHMSKTLQAKLGQFTMIHQLHHNLVPDKTEVQSICIFCITCKV